MMKIKVLIGAAVVGSFLMGTLFQGYLKPGVSNAFNAPETVTPAPVRRVVAAQPVAPRVTQPAVAYTQPAQPTTRVKKRRSWEREVLIIAGSSGAGAAIGGIAGGGKGAAIGAVSGAVAGTVYDVATRNK